MKVREKREKKRREEEKKYGSKKGEEIKVIGLKLENQKKEKERGVREKKKIVIVIIHPSSGCEFCGRRNKIPEEK